MTRCERENEKAKSSALSKSFQSLNTVAPLEPDESTGLTITGKEKIPHHTYFHIRVPERWLQSDL